MQNRAAEKAIFFLLLVFCCTPWGSPPIALALGMAFALLLANPYAAESKKASNILLRTSVVLLGFSMDLGVVLRAGAEGLPFAAATICGTLVLGWLLGRALKIRARTSALIASGTAICGGSAIAAVGSVLGAEEGEMSVAIGTVFLLNAVALYTFPLFGHALHLSQAQFGTWAGVAIHDISSVVGAAQVYGSQALQHATAVKLSRALWIVPLSLGAAAAYKVYTHGAERTAAKVQIPWFIGLFVLASLARSLFPPIAALAPNIAVVAKIGFTLTLFLIGSGLSKKNLKAVGWKPLAQGVALWVFISITSLIVISRTIS